MGLHGYHVPVLFHKTATTRTEKMEVNNLSIQPFHIDALKTTNILQEPTNSYEAEIEIIPKFRIDALLSKLKSMWSET